MSALYIIGSLKDNLIDNSQEKILEKFDESEYKYTEDFIYNINFIYWKIEFSKYNKDELKVEKVYRTRKNHADCHEKDGILIYRITGHENSELDKITEKIKDKIFNDDDFLNCVTNSTDVRIKLNDKDSTQQKYTSIKYFIKGFLTAYRVPIREL